MSGDKKSVSGLVWKVRRRTVLKLRNEAGFVHVFNGAYTDETKLLSTFPSPGGMSVRLDPDFSPLV